MSHIALITTDVELTNIASNAVQRETDYELVQVPTINDYKTWARDNHSHGVMIDMKTLLRGSDDERFFLNELSKFLPVAKIRQVPGKDEITGSYEWEGSSSVTDEDFMGGFVKTMKRFEESLLRRDSVRKQVILNVRVYHPDWKTAVRSNTVNVSLGGLFFISSKKNPKDRWVEVELTDWPKLTRLRAEIRWHLPWGRTRKHYPGFGVRFEPLTEMQRAILVDL